MVLMATIHQKITLEGASCGSETGVFEDRGARSGRPCRAAFARRTRRGVC